MARSIKNTTIAATDAVFAQIAEYGALEGKTDGVRITALDYFANQIASNPALSCDANSGVSELKTAVERYSIPAAAAYVKAQNTAAGYVAVSEASEKTYATYFTTVGMVAAKNADAIAPLLSGTTAFCKGKSKKDLGGRNMLQVYYRSACFIRDAMWPKKIDGKTAAARIPGPKEIGVAQFAQKALDAAESRAPRTPKVTETATPEAPKPDTLDTLKATLLEVAQKLSANDKVPANVRKALLTVSKWS